MKTGRKITGGKYHKSRKKKLYELKGQPRIVKLGEEKKKSLRTRGGYFKTVLLSANFAYVRNKKTNKVKKAKIINVLETPSNKFLAKQNIMTKGAIIETDLGKARVTNRPSQSGSVQAILIE
ncbi:MAG: 30S ribosomal protein S8e [Candidatus Pacearchaeota archaeon]